MNLGQVTSTPALPSTSMAIWITAAAIAVSLHLAVAAFAFVRMQDAESDDLGAPGIEIGIELASPQTQPTELPPGPDSEASVASPAVAEQKTEVKEVDLPKDAPVETENPDRLVTRENTDKPNESEPDVSKMQTKASEESVAQEAKAAPAIADAPQAQKSVTIDQGTGESRQRVRVTWQKQLLAHLDRHKRYPTDRSQQAAHILLSINLDRMGRVIDVTVIKGSGDESFDHAAMAMVQRASPVPAPPPLVADESLSFSLPVVFRAGGKR